MQFPAGLCPYTTERAPGGLKLTRRAVELAALPPGAQVADLGSGGGESIGFLRQTGATAVGIDLSRPESFAGHTVMADAARRLPLKTASMDGVLAECSLSLMASPQEVLAECARVLRSGGGLMISDLYAREPEAAASLRSLEGSCLTGILTQSSLEEWLIAAEFVVEHFEDHSRELREMVARYIFEHGDEQGLWLGGAGGCGGDAIRAAMRQARVGYFLCIARRNPREQEHGQCKTTRFA